MGLFGLYQWRQGFIVLVYGVVEVFGGFQCVVVGGEDQSVVGLYEKVVFYWFCVLLIVVYECYD